MEEEYDVICLGTGFKECILSGLMSVKEKKVLHMDRNDFYGGETASLNLEQLWTRFRPGTPVPTNMGKNRDYCVDLCPKLIMACGNLVKILLTTKMTRSLEFQSVGGSFVYKDGKVHKVPATASEALNSSLMGMFQKRKFKNFLQFVTNYDEKESKTQEGFNYVKQKTKEIYDIYGLDVNTQQFTGHAIALHTSDAYLNEPAKETFEAIKMYAYSVSRYGNSPYIYPSYGLGGIPEGFARLSSIWGGTYMLREPVQGIVYDDQGKVCGVTNQHGKVVKTKMVICDPSYVQGTDLIQLKGRIIRCICILSHPIPNTNNANSAQIILPAHQIPGRKSDMYISLVSYHQKVISEGKYVAVISANQESKDELSELSPALKLLGTIDHQFIWTSDYYEPTQDGIKSQVFVTSSYDATSHFETATDEVLRVYERITGAPLDLSISANPEDLAQDE